MLRKITFATLLLSYACISTAATYSKDSCSSDKASCSTSLWHVELDGLYIGNDVHQTSDLYNGGKAGARTLTYRVEGSYYFDTKRDVSLNYSAFNKTTTWMFDDVAHSSESKFKILNIELGQKFNLGQHAKARYHLGLQYFESLDRAINTETILKHQPRLKGIGPRAGMSVEHELKSNFGIFGDVNIALLRAKLNDRGYLGYINENTYTIAYSTDANIGVYYNKNMSNGDLSLRLGWGAKAVDYSGWDESYLNRNAWSGFLLGAKWVANA